MLVLGGLYGGLFTPTEAGAVGAAGAFVIALMRRRLTWKKLWNVLAETGYVSVSVLFLIMAAIALQPHAGVDRHAGAR